MKTMKLVTLLVMLMIATPALAGPKEPEGYPLALEVTGYSSVHSGYYTTPRNQNVIGNATVSTGGSTYEMTTMISSAILTTATGKIRCTLWNRKRYLTVKTYQARQIAADEIEVLVITKKGKHQALKFQMIRAEKIE